MLPKGWVVGEMAFLGMAIQERLVSGDLSSHKLCCKGGPEYLESNVGQIRFDQQDTATPAARWMEPCMPAAREASRSPSTLTAQTFAQLPGPSWLRSRARH